MSDLADSRWMPPSPHREAILKELEKGRAHLEPRGHNLSPLFVYEDGGAMELALMRLVDGRLVAVADAALPASSTKHVDVCGTVDELERIWEHEPDHAAADPAELLALLDHIMAMLGRMEQRLGAYREFGEALAECAAEMAAQAHPDHAPAPALAADLRAHIAAGHSVATGHVDEMVDLAEAVRKIAGDSELVLYRYRDLCIEVGGLYEAIRGARDWRPRTEEARPR
jgi:hypothetical protein